ncbi:MAG: DUF1127 domain-containing protein [Dinoroseobacter sp.]|nr:DUF1127 domain-containing protein [Dinoroseobacter sp.]
MAYTAVARPALTARRFDPVAYMQRLISEYQAHQTRKALHELSDRQLLDVGLVRADINDLRFGR